MVHIPELFPKIPSYLGTHDPLHLITRVVCTEKLDGANARIGVAGDAADVDAITIGGRELLEGEDGFAQPFLSKLIREDAKLCARLLALARELAAPLTLHGEVCGARIQKQGFIYGSRTHLVLFGARIGGVWVGWRRALPRPDGGHSLPSLVQLAERLELPTAPLLYEGPPDAAVFQALLEQPSAHSRTQGFSQPGVEAIQEGIVIWSDPVLLTPFGTPIVAKLKIPRRREYTPAVGDGDEGLQGFAARAINVERLRHAREFLEARGRWQEPIESMREAVIRRAIQDVAREVPEYHEQLQTHGKKVVRAALESAAAARWAEFVDA